MATRDLVFHLTNARPGKRPPGMTVDFRYTVETPVAPIIASFTTYLRDFRGWRVDSVDTI